MAHNSHARMRCIIQQKIYAYLWRQIGREKQFKYMEQPKWTKDVHICWLLSHIKSVFTICSDKVAHFQWMLATSTGKSTWGDLFPDTIKYSSQAEVPTSTMTWWPPDHQIAVNMNAWLLYKERVWVCSKTDT